MKKKNKKKTKTFKKFKEFVEDTISQVRLSHGLQDYKIWYEFCSQTEKVEHNKVMLAQIIVDDKYLTADIKIFQPLLDHYYDGNYKYIREALCHELAHIRTIPLQKLANERWACPEDIEKQAEKLTEILGRLMYKSVYDKVLGVKVKIKKSKKKK